MIDLGDLFEIDGEGEPAWTHRHLMRDDDWQPTVDDGPHILTCERCGALVPDGSADVHLAWHRKVEGEG